MNRDREIAERLAAAFVKCSYEGGYVDASNLEDVIIDGHFNLLDITDALTAASAARQGEVEKARAREDQLTDENAELEGQLEDATLEITRLHGEVEKARREIVAEVREAVARAAWKHEGDDAYSVGLDRGAREQQKSCLDAIDAIRARLTVQEAGEG